MISPSPFLIAPRTPDPLLPAEAVAAQLGIKVETLANWRSNKRYSLEYVRVGRLIKYRQSAVDRFVESRSVGGAS